MNKLYLKRLRAHIEPLKEAYFNLYQSYGANQSDFDSLLHMMEMRFLDRSETLRTLDERPKRWYLSNDMIGYMVYTDLFAGSLKQLVEKIPYLKELGVTYVHLMPLLKSKMGENDGGYAVEDYLDINPDLGTKEDFEQMVSSFQESDIDICIDYVINHTADSFMWAKQAMKGKKEYQDMYIMFDDRTIPDIYDQHVPEVLPNRFPGNFTNKDEIKKWVFTSFSDFQWDLNFKNPRVFEAMADILLKLANKGVSIIRLDAIPFMWKEVGTHCRNLDQVHDLLHMLHIIKDIVAPSLALLGEAIVEPHEIFKYFGSEERLECGLLYNANFMVNIWNAFATRDVRLLNIDNTRFRDLPSRAGWMNYVRCHDDIGWGLNEQALEDLGVSAFHHKQYLIQFYGGQFPNSFARGEQYQYNAISKDARTNGTCASLLGLEKAIEEHYPHEKYIAIQRILLGHAMIYSHRGIPLIYSGDEISSLNDRSYLKDSSKKTDSRWIHRPSFDWERAEKRNAINSVENEVFQGLRRMSEIRKKNPLFSGDLDVEVVVTSDIAVYSCTKEKAKERLVCLFNFSEHIKEVDATPYHKLGIQSKLIDLMSDRIIDFSTSSIRLAPYEFVWVVYR